VECNPKENPYNVQYIRTAGVPEGEDPKTYDFGRFYYATVGMPAANNGQVIGEIWASYEIELRKPQASVFNGFGTFYTMWSGYNAIGNANPALAIPFNNQAVYFDNLGFTVSGNTIVFPDRFTGGLAFVYECNVSGTLNNPSLSAPTTVSDNTKLTIMQPPDNNRAFINGAVPQTYTMAAGNANTATYATTWFVHKLATGVVSTTGPIINNLTTGLGASWSLRVYPIPSNVFATPYW